MNKMKIGPLLDRLLEYIKSDPERNKEIRILEDQIGELTKLVKVVITPQTEACTPVNENIAEEEAIALMKNQIFMKHNPKKMVD